MTSLNLFNTWPNDNLLVIGLGAAIHTWNAGKLVLNVIAESSHFVILCYKAFGIPVEGDVPVYLGYRLTVSYPGPINIEDLQNSIDTWHSRRRRHSNEEATKESTQSVVKDTTRWDVYLMMEGICKR